jgi:hypothetical protein
MYFLFAPAFIALATITVIHLKDNNPWKRNG